jgi:hypothetical protein
LAKGTFASSTFRAAAFACATLAGPPAAPAEALTGVGAAVRLKPFFSGADPLVLTAGEDGLAFLIPAAEPLSAGAPPVPPVLLQGLSTQHNGRVMPTRSGQVATTSLQTMPRPTVTVKWDGLTLTERASVLSFLRDTCGAGVLAFDLEPDGPGSGAVKVRQVGPESLEDVWESRPAYSVTVQCEEVF